MIMCLPKFLHVLCSTFTFTVFLWSNKHRFVWTYVQIKRSKFPRDVLCYATHGFSMLVCFTCTVLFKERYFVILIRWPLFWFATGRDDWRAWNWWWENRSGHKTNPERIQSPDSRVGRSANTQECGGMIICADILLFLLEKEKALVIYGQTFRVQFRVMVINSRYRSKKHPVKVAHRI